MKKRIICDVNIWYRIGEGKIVPSSFADYCLVASQQNIREIGSSNVLIYDPDLAKKAILAIDEYACEVIPLDPFDDYIKTYIDHNYSPANVDYYKKVFQTILSWAKGKVNFNLDTESKRKELQDKIKEHDSKMDLYSDSVYALLPTIRANKRQALIKNPKEEDYLMASMIDLVFGIISDRLGLAKDQLTLPTDQLELLIRGWTELHKNIILQHQGKMKVNDPDDMPYLAYVRKDDLFWSGDYKFLNKINAQPSDPDIDKYLFDKDRTLINV